MERKCLVTGATGALGSALVRSLDGRGVRVLVRSEEAFREQLSDLDVDAFEGDLTVQADIDRAIDDVDTVFHCAGTSYFD